MPSSRRGKWAGAGWRKSAFGPRLGPAHPTQQSSLRWGPFLCQTESDFQIFPHGRDGKGAARTQGRASLACQFLPTVGLALITSPIFHHSL